MMVLNRSMCFSYQCILYDLLHCFLNILFVKIVIILLQNEKMGRKRETIKLLQKLEENRVVIQIIKSTGRKIALISIFNSKVLLILATSEKRYKKFYRRSAISMSFHSRPVQRLVHS